MKEYIRSLNEKTKKKIALGFSIGLSIAIFSFLLLFPFDREDLENMGYLGIFVSNALSSATVFIPAPGILTSIYAVKFYNPWVVAIVSATAYVVGDFTAYLFGFGIENAVDKYRWYTKLEKFYNKTPFIFSLVWAAIPNPFFDLIGVLAGAANYSFRLFVIATFIGRIIRAFIIAFVSYQILA